MSTKHIASLALPALFIGACAVDGTGDFDTPNATPQGNGAIAARYIVSCNGELPADFTAVVAANGDVLVHSTPHAGLALVETANAAVYDAGSCDVVESMVMQWLDPVENVEL